MNKKTANILKKLGVPPHIRGYEYLGEAVEMIHADPSLLRAVTRVLYPAVAKKVGGTAGAVDRGIRLAVDHSMNNLDYEQIEELFGSNISPDKGRPTAKHFLVTAVELMEE